MGCGTTPTKEKITGIYSANYSSGEREEELIRFFENGVVYDGTSWVLWQLKGQEVHLNNPDDLLRAVFRINANGSMTLIKGVNLDSGEVKEVPDGDKVTLEKLAGKNPTPAMIDEASAQKVTLEKAAAKIIRIDTNDSVADPIAERAIREKLEKPQGALTEADLVKVTDLSFLFTDVTDTSLKDVAKLKNLDRLVLARTDITDAGLKEVAKLQQLTSLDLSDTEITESGLKEVGKLEQLRVLYLSPKQFSNAKIDDNGLKEVGKLRELIYLELTRTQITDEGLKEVAKLQKLEDLSLVGNTQITDEGLKEVAKLQKLKKLDLRYIKITDTGLQEVAKLGNLERLALAKADVTDAGLKALAKLRKLKVFTLSAKKITKEGVEELMQSLPNCRITWGNR